MGVQSQPEQLPQGPKANGSQHGQFLGLFASVAFIGESTGERQGDSLVVIVLG